jgi:hypothetical protein
VGDRCSEFPLIIDLGLPVDARNPCWPIYLNPF